jgi:hypothetical protein
MSEFVNTIALLASEYGKCGDGMRFTQSQMLRIAAHQRDPLILLLCVKQVICFGTNQ